jgi:hypothetical protein
MIVEYRTDGVRFTVPDKVMVVTLPTKNPKTTQTEFSQAKRPIINFKIIEVTNAGKGKLKTKFKPPLEIEVHYKKIDDDSAGGAKLKKLAFFDDNDKLWKIITKNKHGFDPKEYVDNDPKALPGFKGYGVAIFNSLPDPLIGWGP